MVKGFECPNCKGFFPFLKAFQPTITEYIATPPEGDESLPRSYFSEVIDWIGEEAFECPNCGLEIAHNEDEASKLVKNKSKYTDLKQFQTFSVFDNVIRNNESAKVDMNPTIMAWMVRQYAREFSTKKD